MKNDAVIKSLLFTIAAFLGIIALKPVLVQDAQAQKNYNPLQNAVVLNAEFIKSEHNWRVEALDRSSGRIVMCALKKGRERSHCTYWSGRPQIR